MGNDMQSILSTYTGRKTHLAQEMDLLMEQLFPICRSITGDGVRATLGKLKDIIPLDIHEIASGTKVFDWTVPREWNIKDAYIKDEKGNKIVDFQKSNLHVLGYSVPVNKEVDLKELKDHLFTLPEYPDRIPYRTSYYNDNWGFCIKHSEYLKLKEGRYKVFIGSSLKPGALSYGEYFIPGESRDEILLTCYTCHPSLANDNLSGIVLLTFLAKLLSGQKLHYSYRFLFIPETIGAICWLAKNEKNIGRIKHGLVVTCVGDKGFLRYKQSRQGNAVIDKAAEKVLLDCGEKYEIMEFSVSGSDERQFCSPGFNLPVGSLTRTIYGQFPEQHSSADNLDFVDGKYIVDTLGKYLDVIFILENNKTYLNLNPKCEPQLGRRGLYLTIGAKTELKINERAILWVLNLSDGNYSLLDIAIRSKMQFKDIKNAADLLFEKELLKEV